MMMRWLPLSAGCLVTVLIILCDLDQSIRTAGDSESYYGQVSISPCSSKDKVPNGLVTIELSSGSPSYVCLNGFDRGAAAAVCHQLGHVDADPVLVDGEQRFFGPPDLYGCSDKTSPAKVISYVQCPNVSDYFLYGELHVMRCLVGEPVNNTNECQLTALKCSSKRLMDDGYTYNGRVSFESSDLNHGLVQINLHGTAKFVCLDGLDVLDEEARDTISSSVCRQMGFTNGIASPTDSQNVKDPTYLFKSPYCNSETGSYQCFSHCINQTEVTSPADCQQVLSVTCSYDPSVAELMTSGSPRECSLQERCSSLPVSTNTSTTSPYFISTIVLGAVLGTESIFCLVCNVCLIACLRRRQPPPPVFNDHNRPNANEHQVLLRNNDDVYQRED